MGVNIKTRHIRELRSLPISEMSDEEIVKAALDRLNTKSLLMVYVDENRMMFLARYKKGGLPPLQELKAAWEEKFGKLSPIEDIDE